MYQEAEGEPSAMRPTDIFASLAESLESIIRSLSALPLADEDSEMPPYIFNPFPSTPGRRAQRAWPSDGIDSDDPMFGKVDYAGVS